MNEIDQPELISTTVEGALKMTGGAIGRTTMHRLIADGTIRSVKLGKRRLISVASLRELIDGAA